jgi:hypothetical protein
MGGSGIVQDIVASGGADAPWRVCILGSEAGITLLEIPVHKEITAKQFPFLQRFNMEPVSPPLP